MFCIQYASKFGKFSSGHRTGKGKFSFQSQRKAMPKSAQTTTQLHISHMLAKWCSKFSKPGFNSTWTKNFPMFKLDLGGKKKKNRETRDQIPNICWKNQKKKERESSRKTSAAAAKSLQSCPTLCNPIDESPPGSPIPGILQARTLEWVAISFSNAWKWKMKGKSLSRVRLLVTPWTAAHQAPPSMGFSRQEYWSGSPLPSPRVELLTSKYWYSWLTSNSSFAQA